MELDKYIIVTWPESQLFMDMPKWEDNSYLINDDKGMEKFGSSAYFVSEEWYNYYKDKV